MQAISPRSPKSISWSTAMVIALGFWLSGSLILDFLIVPGMLTSGMMNESGFASAGYTIFGTFNHVELLCAATVLAGCLVYRFSDLFNQRVSFKSLSIAAVLLAITLVYTYVLTPQMSSMGMSLDWFATVKVMPPAMKFAHLSYWSLEAIKLIAIGTLLRNFYRKSYSLV